MSGSKTPTASSIPSRTPPSVPKQDMTGSFKFPAPEREGSKVQADPFDNSEWEKELVRRASTEVNEEDMENEYDIVINTEGTEEEF